MIGGADERPGYAIGSLAGAVLLDDRIVIADGQMREIRYYSLAGDLLARVGGRGGGPGEYSVIRSVVRYGYSAVAVWDVQQLRLTVLDRDGTTLDVILPNFGDAGPSPAFVGVLATGHVVFRVKTDLMSLGNEPTGERRDSVVYLIIEPDGSNSGTKVVASGSEVYFVNSGRHWADSPVIYGRTDVAAVIAGVLLLGLTDSLSFRQFDHTGNVLRNATFPFTARAVQDQWVDVERSRLLRETEAPSRLLERHGMTLQGSDDLDSAQRRRIEELPNRSTLPAFRLVIGDLIGNTWVSSFEPAVAVRQHWLVLDSVLNPLARLSTARDPAVLSIGRDAMLIRTQDELDRAGVQLFRLER